MSRRISLLSFCLALFFSFLLSQCGSSSPTDGALGKLPGAWAKYLAVGTITATLDVYREDGEKELNLELSIDSQTGTVSSAPFKLGLGSTYRFIITFHYAVTAQDSIPYAYADFTRLIDDFGEEVSFTENDIRYGHNVDDPSIASDLSRGVLPDLDLDRDGWTNWEELRDKVNPQNGNSVPIPPTVDVTGLQDGSATTATITVIARDNAHVEKLRLADPVCGIIVISDTQSANVDGSVTRTLVVRLDLLSVSKSSRALQAVADDGVTPSQDDNETLQFSISGTASQPYFAFTEPEENSEVEGPTVFRGIACSRSEIELNSLKFLNSEISEFAWSGQRNELSGDFMVESEPVDTEALPDGVNLLKVEVKDASNKVGQGDRSYIVTNDSQIKVISPVGRRWVFGNEQIAVSAKDLPDSNIVIAETGGDFNLKSSTAGGLVGVLDVSNLEDGSVIPIKFKAVRGDGSEVIRQVDFTVRNKPQIEVFPKASKLFRAWSTELQFRIVNVQPDLIRLDGQAPGFSGSIACAEDSVAERITVCSGFFPAKVTQSKSFILSAERLPGSDEECQFCTNEKSTALTMIGALAEDLPEINVAIEGDDEPVSPSRVRVLAENPVKHYRLTVTEAATGAIAFEDVFTSGEGFPVTGLDARTDYRGVLQMLSGPGGNVDAEMFKDVTTGDLGLVGWWRFKDDVLAVDCPGESGPYTVCDYSGRNNHGDPIGGVSWIEPTVEFLDGAMSFDGQSGYINVPGNSSLNIGVTNELTISCFINPQHNQENVEIITKDHPDSGPYNLGQTSSDQIYFSVYSENSGMGSWKITIAELAGRINTKFRATGTYGANLLKLFFDDQFQAQSPISGYITNYSQPLKIGWSPYFNSFYSGVISDCYIFNRALSAGEIALISDQD